MLPPLLDCSHRLAPEVWEPLAAYRPVLAGTIPIGIDLPESDLDILCEVTDFDAFAQHMTQLWAHLPDFYLNRKSIRQIPCIIIRFTYQEEAIELFGQAIPVQQQYAYRHMMIEHRLLHLLGTTFRQKIMQLRYNQWKTEPAFAHLLGLEGDPYEALLTLENYTNEEILIHVGNFSAF